MAAFPAIKHPTDQYECNGMGGFGVYFKNNQLRELIGGLKTNCKTNINIKTIISPEVSRAEGAAVTKAQIHNEDYNLDNILSKLGNDYGGKLLLHFSDYKEEIDGIKNVWSIVKDNYGLLDNTNKKILGITIKHAGWSKNGSFFKFKAQIKKNEFVLKEKMISGHHLYFVLQKDMITYKEYIEKRSKDNAVIQKNVIEYNNLCIKNIINPLLEQVNTLHNNGYVHRDIKPDNIMFYKDDKGTAVASSTVTGTTAPAVAPQDSEESENNNYKATLIDFGLLDKIENFSFGAGTIYYMSPHYKMLSRINNYDYNINYNNFFKMISSENLKRIAQTNQNYETVLKHNDYYAIGLSIQEICGYVLPYIKNPKENWYNDLYNTAKRMFPIYIEDDEILDGNSDFKNYSIRQKYDKDYKPAGGGVMKVFGKKRRLFYMGGGDSTKEILYVKLKEKNVPVKDALRFEKKIMNEFMASLKV